jgi:hypothetical protein
VDRAVQTFGCGAIGFVDDYKKAVRKGSQASARAKLIGSSRSRAWRRSAVLGARLRRRDVAAALEGLPSGARLGLRAARGDLHRRLLERGEP